MALLGLSMVLVAAAFILLHLGCVLPSSRYCDSSNTFYLVMAGALVGCYTLHVIRRAPPPNLIPPAHRLEPDGRRYIGQAATHWEGWPEGEWYPERSRNGGDPFATLDASLLTSNWRPQKHSSEIPQLETASKTNKRPCLL
ncbi:hypothetical protein MKEN_00440400 [Mycena kentingensis (nom. inval.)]|nr:hypothetical protein MKEN_00440400 [Mycena kentingensis (nom. inval.)]